MEIKPEIVTFPVEEGGDQKIIFRTEMQNSETGEHDRATIEVRDFANVGAALAAIVEFAYSVLSVHGYDPIVEMAAYNGPGVNLTPQDLHRSIRG